MTPEPPSIAERKMFEIESRSDSGMMVLHTEEGHRYHFHVAAND